MDRIVDWFGEQGCDALTAIGLLDSWGCGERQLGWVIIVAIMMVVVFLFFRSVMKSIG